MTFEGNLNAMTTYTIHAVLPGVGCAVETDDGKVGFVGYDLEFREMFPTFIESAVHKYGYERIHPTEVDALKMDRFMASVLRDA